MGVFALSAALFISLTLAAPTTVPSPSSTQPQIELLRGDVAIPMACTGSSEDLRAEVLTWISQDWDKNGQKNNNWYAVRCRSSPGECTTGGFRVRMLDDNTVVLEKWDSGAVRQMGDPSPGDWRSVESRLRTLLNDNSMNSLLNHRQ